MVRQLRVMKSRRGTQWIRRRPRQYSPEENRPARPFELTEVTRWALDEYLRMNGPKPGHQGRDLHAEARGQAGCGGA